MRTITRCLTAARPLLLASLTLAGAAACNGDDPVAPPARVLTAVTVSVAPVLEVGQMMAATASGSDQNGDPIELGPVTWTSDQPTIAAVNQSTGFVFAIAPGTTRVTAMVDGKVGERTIAVTTAPAIRVNEVQPKAETPTGWLEFFNSTNAAVDISGWTLIGTNFFGPSFTFPAGTVIPAGGFLVTEETALPFGLDATGSAYLFSRFGVLVDAAAWAAQPATTYGRCPEGTGTFVVTTAPTKGLANACPTATGSALGAPAGAGVVQIAQ